MKIFLNSLMIFGILLVTILSVACINSDVHFLRTFPEGALDEYIKAINERDASTIYNIASIDLRPQFNHEFLVKNQDPIRITLNKLQEQNKKIDYYESKIISYSADHVIFEVDLVWSSSNNTLVYERKKADFVKESQGWKINNLAL